MRPPPRIKKDMPQHEPKVRDGMSAVHLDDIRACQCLICGAENCKIDPHHLMRVDAGARGLSLKAVDKWTVPLCRRCHALVTKAANDDEWFAARGFDSRAIAKALWSRTGDRTAMYRVVFDYRQRAALKLRANALTVRTNA